MEHEEKGKKGKNRKGKFYHSLAYVVLLKERMASNPNYTVNDLNVELAGIANSVGVKK